MTSSSQKFISALQYLYCKEVSPIIKPKYFATATHVHYLISDLPKEKSVLLLYYSLPVSATLSGEQGDPSHCCLHRVGCASSSNIVRSPPPRQHIRSHIAAPLPNASAPPMHLKHQKDAKMQVSSWRQETQN